MLSVVADANSSSEVFQTNKLNGILLKRDFESVLILLELNDGAWRKQIKTKF